MIANVCFMFALQELDETLTERLWGLTEMFPEGVRNITSTVVSSTCTGIKGFCHISFLAVNSAFQVAVCNAVYVC
jgi:import receptor subunit TOM22